MVPARTQVCASPPLDCRDHSGIYVANTDDVVRCIVALHDGEPRDTPSCPKLTPDHTLIDATTRTIQIALQAQSGETDPRLRDEIQRLCADGRRLGARPEELIVLFKKVWTSLPQAHGQPRDGGNSALDRVITMCIEEYYRGDSRR